MGRMRRMLAVWVGRVVKFGCLLAGKQGVTTVGQVALKIDPDILKDLSEQVREKIFVVCGTNGKTTTNNLLCAAIEEEGKKLVCNHTGSNMLNGIAAAFVLAAGLDGNLDADYACIEIDEASARKAFRHFKPDYMILTNLFRDQLDRYGEIDITMKLLKEAMDMAPDMKLIVNADDSLSAYLATDSKNPYATYGISEQVFKAENKNEIREGLFCKKCGSKLDYRFFHYSQIGTYSCSKCDFKRPAVDYDAGSIDLENGLNFVVDGHSVHADYRGFYNIYNILAAYAGVREAGLSDQKFDDMLSSFNPQNGRNEEFLIDGTKVILNLAKNPAGFNQNIGSVMTDRNLKDLIIVINDRAQDGIDVSWLWDVDFERLAEERIRSITVSGIRCQDMRLRLKYVDIPCMLEEEVETAIRKRIADGCKNLYVLVNYTALYPTGKILKKLEKKNRDHKIKGPVRRRKG